MTYCVGVRLEEGLIFASDSRTHAGVDDDARLCKMTVFERPGDRVLVMLKGGSRSPIAVGRGGRDFSRGGTQVDQRPLLQKDSDLRRRRHWISGATDTPWTTIDAAAVT